MATKLTTPFPSVDPTNQLTITDLPEVLQLLRRHGYSGVSYYSLGLFLGLSPATLDVIAYNNKDSVESRLRDCLNKWLQKADNVQKTKGGPTIYSLLSALRELENGVADGIDMEKHPACRILAHYSSDQSLLSGLPRLGELLSSEVIGEMKMSQREALLVKIKAAVCHDYKKLEAFADILCKYKVTAEIGRAIMRDYREAYGSDYENGILVKGCATSEFKMMRLKFGQIFIKVESIMMNNPQSPSLGHIKNVLGTCYTSLRPQLAHCKDIRDILQLVRDNSSLDDIRILEYLVNEYNIEEAKSVIEEYKEAVEKFKSTMIVFQCLNESFSIASPLECERITIVVDNNADESVLKDVQRLSSIIFMNLSSFVRLNVIRECNSLAISYSFPLILSEQLITAALDNIDVLKENKVKRLTIGYCTVYEVDIIDDVSHISSAADRDQYTSTSSGQSKQLMLSLSVQLINSTEEVTTLNQESMTMKKEAESLKKTLVTKSKMLTASLAESEILKRIAAETKQLLQEKILLLTGREEENEKLKEIKQLLEEQLALFLSEKEDLPTTDKQLEELEKKLKEEIQPSSSLMRQKEAAIREKEEQIKIEELQLKLKLQQVEVHKEASGLHELPTGQYTMNNDEEYDINVKDSNDEVETEIETENKEIQTTQTTTVYAGQVFYERSNRMRFLASTDLNMLHQHIRKQYSHVEFDQSVTFKLQSPKHCIELIFNDEQQADSITGWRVKPHLVPCQIEEHEILGFGDISTTIPPSCLVSIYAENSPHTVPYLSYSVLLKGVQKPKEIVINRSLRDILLSPSVPNLPVSGVPVVVTDDTNLGLCALNALKKQQDKLKSLLSRSEPIFRDIAVACKSATIIHSTEYDKIFDVKTGQSLAERADTFINCIMSVVDVCPDQLEVFLNIVMNKGNIAFVRIAELISQCFNGEVPEQCCIKLNKQ